MNEARILVVDDSPFMLKIITTVLKKQGYSFCTATDGKDALRKIAEEKPCVAFLDAVMPLKDGYEVCRQTKANPSLQDIYVVMATGQQEPEARQRAIDAGADGYLFKPYAPPKILEQVRTALGEDR